MAATALPNFINNVITALQNSSALTGVQIYDGPTVSIDSYPSNWIAIGHDGNEDGDVSVGTFRNNWELVGNYKRWLGMMATRTAMSRWEPSAITGSWSVITSAGKKASSIARWLPNQAITPTFPPFGPLLIPCSRQLTPLCVQTLASAVRCCILDWNHMSLAICRPTLVRLVSSFSLLLTVREHKEKSWQKSKTSQLLVMS